MGFLQHIISAWSRSVAEKGFLVVKGYQASGFFSSIVSTNNGSNYRITVEISPPSNFINRCFIA